MVYFKGAFNDLISMPEAPEYELPENYGEILSAAETLASLMRNKVAATIGTIDPIFRCQASDSQLVLSHNEGFHSLAVLHGETLKLNVKIGDQAGTSFINRLGPQKALEFLNTEIAALEAR